MLPTRIRGQHVLLYALPFVLAGLLCAPSTSANLEKPVPRTAYKRKFLSLS
jgi:hypothetical protein